MRLNVLLKNMSIRTKLLGLFVLIGLVPLIFTFLISQNEIRTYALNGQRFADNQAYEQTLNTLSNLVAHIEEISLMIIVNGQINDALSASPMTTPVSKQIALFQAVTSYTQILESDSQFDHILYYVNDQFLISGDNAVYFRPLKQLEEEKWLKELGRRNGKPVWLLSGTTSADSMGESYLSLGRLLWNPKNYSQSTGAFTVNINLDRIKEMLRSSVKEQLVYIVTDKGTVAASNNNQLLKTMKLPQPLESGSSFSEVNLPAGPALARGNRIGGSDLYLVSVISAKSANQIIHNIWLRMGTVYSVVGILILLIIFPVTKSLTHRIFLLMNKMSQVRQGRLKIIDLEPRSDELGHLISSYNYMIESVQELLKEQFRLGQEKKGAELRALQSQINPHFLYNTLDTMSWLAHKQEGHKVQEIIYALSNYYKLVLNKGGDAVTLESEVQICKIYMELQKYRYKDRIQLEIDLGADTGGCILPKITLQPLVENSIMHGINEKAIAEGVIRIKTALCENRLLIWIEDDGVGFTEKSEKHAKYNGSGYGLKNIENRLMLFFNESLNPVQIISEKDHGSCIVINVPAIYES
ncbi:cache domain-containing sensor histidine kinase [Paenibacillus donghaensis]|uniref:HAMP domain-containing protein n=1 Tax=Paenibacillus donghaensis TaxID=414771 RepID=A0A2Z2KQ45_9BACL|nr:sensor histidine kinase [Paenibacillus donghaensis]ASA23482.1 hypothetical protein B9T62_23370 [Paenibacillus donghaensis]